MIKLDRLRSSFQLGDLTLRNRAVMGPMTRSRAIDNVPNELMAEYYRQRAAEPGLVLTEGTAPSPNGLGYPRIPGMYSDAQVEGWRKVVDGVHEAGAKVFIQLMHVGRIGHPLNFPDGGELVAPSAVQAAGDMYTDQEGPKPHPEPRAMNNADVEQALGEFVHAAKRAREAGFDGIELHGANGYLINQFLNPRTNQRSDAWGGSPEARNRFALEAARRTAEAIGKGRVGIRLSPYGVFNDLAPFDEIDDQYEALAKGLSEIGVAYIHTVDHASMGAPQVPTSVKTRIRNAFNGPIMLSGGFDGASAEAALTENRGELVAFSRPFLANPDLLTRYERDSSLNELRPDLFYTPGPEGYTDYPTLAS